MVPFRVAACALCLSVSTLLVAEQVLKPAVKKAHETRCHGVLANRRTTNGPCKHAVISSATTSSNGVVIYNGNQRQMHIFDAAKDPAVIPAKNLRPVVIGIANGVSTPQRARPVVVGVSSGAVAASKPVVVNIASSGTSTQPVVLGVASAGFQAAGAVQPVAVAVSPRPAKRRPYRPAALDAQ